MSATLTYGGIKKFYGTGRRREAVARVYLKPGAARFTVNGRPVDEYFKNVAWHTAAVEPLKFTQMQDQVEVAATVKGGGVGGQAGAVRMGLSRALSVFNP
ncbi:MAG: 30S ribosomal protein S9, partial [Candidatus Acidiferrales bacterium]